MKEKKARVEDALHATRAAVEEGIVPGGGVALLRAASALDALKLDGDEATGVRLVRRALEEPLRQIARNAGAEGSVVVEKVRDGQGRVRLQRGDRAVRRPAQGGRHRPGEGRAHGARARGERGRHDADDRGRHRREAQEGEAGARRRRRDGRRWAGWAAWVAWAAWGAWVAWAATTSTWTEKVPALARKRIEGARPHDGGRAPCRPHIRGQGPRRVTAFPGAVRRPARGPSGA